jgi:hypothetical protein
MKMICIARSRRLIRCVGTATGPPLVIILIQLWTKRITRIYALRCENIVWQLPCGHDDTCQSTIHKHLCATAIRQHQVTSQGLIAPEPSKTAMHVHVYLKVLYNHVMLLCMGPNQPQGPAKLTRAPRVQYSTFHRTFSRGRDGGRRNCSCCVSCCPSGASRADDNCGSHSPAAASGAGVRASATRLDCISW